MYFGNTVPMLSYGPKDQA